MCCLILIYFVCKNTRFIEYYQYFFLPPRINRLGAYSFCPVCLSAKNFNIGHNFWMVSDRTFMFHMCIPSCKTFSSVPRSRSNVKVTIFKNNHFMGIRVSQTHLVFFLFLAHLSTTCSKGAFRVVRCPSSVVHRQQFH